MTIITLFDETIDGKDLFDKSRLLSAISIFIIPGRKEVISSSEMLQKLVQIYADTLDKDTIQVLLIYIIALRFRQCDLTCHLFLIAS